jgi:hypothetical protein
MRLEDRLRRELHDTAEQLILDRDKYEEAVRRGQRRRQLLVTSGVASGVVVGLAVIALLTFDPAPNGVVATTAATDPTATTAVAPETTIGDTSAFGRAVLVPGPLGLSLESLAGGETLLQSDRYYTGIAWAVSDAAGGLIYQHDVTPLPWAQGTLLQLPAGASTPVPLVQPALGEYVRPLGVGDGVLIYRLDWQGGSSLMGYDLATQATREIMPSTDYLFAASVGHDTVIAAVGDPCTTFMYFDVSGAQLAPPAWDQGECLSIVDLAFTGTHLYTLEDTGDGRVLVHRDYATGETEIVPADDAWQIAALPDGTIALNGSVARVGHINAGVFEEEFTTSGVNSIGLAELGLTLAGANLGSGENQLPCTPLSVPAPEPQDVPAAVEATRQEIFSLAAACEMEALANLARTDAIAFSYGGETDPLLSWIRSARNGFDVMTWLVRILNSTPALDQNDGSYAWPAVHITNSEEDWQALSGILAAAEYEQLYGARDSGYLGLRVGIAADGTWRYAIAGD